MKKINVAETSNENSTMENLKGVFETKCETSMFKSDMIAAITQDFEDALKTKTDELNTLKLNFETAINELVFFRID